MSAAARINHEEALPCLPARLSSVAGDQGEIEIREDIVSLVRCVFPHSYPLV